MSGDYISTEISNFTLEIDGQKIYKDGRPMILDDPKLREAAETFGLSDWQ